MLQNFISSKKDVAKWQKRHSYDIVVLLDRCSTEQKMKADLHINILKEILLKVSIPHF